MDKSWVLGIEKVTRIEGSSFFKALPKYFPDATILWVTIQKSTPPDLIMTYQVHALTGEEIPEGWSDSLPSDQFLCRFSPHLMEELAHLSENNWGKDFFETLILLKGKAVLLFWHLWAINDDSELFVTADMPEATLTAFAADLGLPTEIDATEIDQYSDYDRPYLDSTTWHLGYQNYEMPVRLTGRQKILQKIPKVGFLVIVLFVLWLFVSRGCSQ